MANMKNCNGRILETDNSHCGYCFKSFSVCILFQFSTATVRRMVELTSPLGTGRYVSLRFGLMGSGDANNFVSFKSGMMIWASSVK